MKCCLKAIYNDPATFSSYPATLKSDHKSDLDPHTTIGFTLLYDFLEIPKALL